MICHHNIFFSFSTKYKSCQIVNIDKQMCDFQLTTFPHLRDVDREPLLSELKDRSYITVPIIESVVSELRIDLIPSGNTNKLQVLDIGVNIPLKDNLCELTVCLLVILLGIYWFIFKHVN